jgi:hypothetical protein
MEFGSFTEFPPITAHERVGLDAVWLAELHGSSERSVLISTAVSQK